MFIVCWQETEKLSSSLMLLNALLLLLLFSFLINLLLPVQQWERCFSRPSQTQIWSFNLFKVASNVGMFLFFLYYFETDKPSVWLQSLLHGPTIIIKAYVIQWNHFFRLNCSSFFFKSLWHFKRERPIFKWIWNHVACDRVTHTMYVVNIPYTFKESSRAMDTVPRYNAGDHTLRIRGTPSGSCLNE